MEAGLPFSKAFIFFFFNIPFIISQITPIGILLAVLVVFGLMSKNNEIIALKMRRDQYLLPVETSAYHWDFIEYFSFFCL